MGLTKLREIVSSLQVLSTGRREGQQDPRKLLVSVEWSLYIFPEMPYVFEALESVWLSFAISASYYPETVAYMGQDMERKVQSALRVGAPSSLKVHSIVRS